MPTPAQIQKMMKQRQARQKSSSKSNGKFEIQLFQKVKARDVADFTRQLATMSLARLPLARSLEILAQQQKNQKFKQMIHNILRSVKSGKALSDSLSSYPKLFPSLYVNMVYVGEVSGNMPEILQQLAVYAEKINELRRKFITAMTYPAVIVLVAIGAVSFLVFGVMPTFKDMFQDFGATLPLPTQILLGVSGFFKSNFLYLLIGLLAIIFSLRAFIRTTKGAWFFDHFKLKMPIIGSVVKKIFISRFTRTLGTLLGSGVSLLEALEITANSLHNRVMKKQVLKMRTMAEKGEPMERSFSDSKLFPPLVVQMIAVGEETAELPDMLTKTAEFYESEVDAAIEALTSIIEPIIIVVLGVILGGTIIAIYLQIFDLMNVVQ